jgi:hypothetical protein
METTETEKGATIRGRILALGEPNMEVRLAKLEAHVEHIQSDISEIKADLRDLRKDVKDDFKDVRGDIYKLLAALIAAVLGLAGIMAKGFGWL